MHYFEARFCQYFAPMEWIDRTDGKFDYGLEIEALLYYALCISPLFLCHVIIEALSSGRWHNGFFISKKFFSSRHELYFPSFQVTRDKMVCCLNIFDDNIMILIVLSVYWAVDLIYNSLLINRHAIQCWGVQTSPLWTKNLKFHAVNGASKRLSILSVL